ncbi:MAG: DUF2207 domain-containing protein [Alphaproteobacteria bacterium]|nr:DUF2207 domain-containing protein [Alphaproteobacteria bacterium]
MQKNFLSICFIVTLFAVKPCLADVIPITGMNSSERIAMQKQRLKNKNTLPPGLPDPKNQEEVRKFFKKRFEEVAKTPMDDKTDWSQPSSISIIQPPEYYEQEEQKNKSLFQQMYEKAIAALHQDENQVENDNEAVADSEEVETADTATRFFTLKKEEDKPQDIDTQIPVVSLSLPSGKTILAPAQEHIPYFLSYIDIQANGYVKVEDTISIVANGKKFARGLRRVFPKYTPNGQHTELILEKVTVNNTRVPYITEEIGDDIVIKPKYNQKLESGVYTYRFYYYVNNKLFRNGKNVILDWNLTGRPMNAFLTSANIIVTIPDGHSFDNASVYVGRNNSYSVFRTNAYRLAGNVIAFSNRTPLFNGENMNLVASINQNVFIKDFDKSLSNFLLTWGNILYAGIGLAIILVSFLLSLANLRRDRKNSHYTPSYNGGFTRTLLANKYDRTAFVAQILELYRKNALDLQNDNNRIYLNKGYHKGKLTKAEEKAVKVFFPKKSERLEVNNINNGIFKKAKKFFEKEYSKKIRKYNIFHNIIYVLFSCGMLICTEMFIAFNSINIAQTMIVLLATSLLYAFYIWIICHKFKHWYTTIPVKIFSLLALCIVWIFSSIYVGKLTGLLIMISIIIIFGFMRLFSHRNSFVQEALETIKKYKEYLISNADIINISRDFLNQQSNIFALNITEHFPQNTANSSYYKLDDAERLSQALIGII